MRRALAILLALALATPAGAASTIIGGNDSAMIWGETLGLGMTCQRQDTYVGMSENQVKTKYLRGNLTVKNLTAHVTANTLGTSSTIRSRKNTATGNMSITVGAGVTGHLTATNSDALSANDFWNAQYVAGGSSGQSATLGHVTAELQSTASPTVCVLGSGYHDGITQAAGLTRYTRIFGNLDMGSGTASASETSATFRVYADGWAKALQVGYAQAITADTTVTLRKNGADTALAVSIPSGSSAGHYIDGSNMVRVARGDLIDAKIVTGSGSGTLKVQQLALYIESDTNMCDIGVSGAKSVSGAGARADYFSMIGDLQTYSTSTSVHQLTFPFATRVGRVRCLTSTSPSGGNTATVAVRIGGTASSASVSIASGSTAGWTEAADGAYADIAATDLVDMKLSSAGTWNADVQACAMTINYDPTPRGGFVQAIQ